MAAPDKPVVAITGIEGGIGSALAKALSADYTVIGFDRDCDKSPDNCFAMDLTSDASVELALTKARERFGGAIASFVHLAAYFDFTGEENPLYESVNVEGTRRLLRHLQDFRVEQFVYAGTMLVHAAVRPGERIDERSPIDPKWAYPRSKAAAEAAIAEERGDMPCVILRLAGVYDERHCVPTLAHQIARIYERDLKSHFYAGDVDAGQSFLHTSDMLDAFRRAIDRRKTLPADFVPVLIGEPDALSYRRLQEILGRLVHGEDEWSTLSLPKPLAKAGAALEAAAEPVIPDALDQGEEPFIRPFMIDMADDHYALDVSRAKRLLGWEPTHRLRDVLPRIVRNLKADPVGWYEANGLTPPAWLKDLDERAENPERLRAAFEERSDALHRRGLWTHFANMALGTWLITSPPILGYESAAMTWSDVLSGLMVIGLSALALSRRFALVRWAVALVGVWILFAPILFWTPSAAAYLNGTLVGALVFGFAVCLPPFPGVQPVAEMTGPTIPPGWDYTPSSYLQRAPVILLAFIGLYFSRYLAAYQLGHVETVWDPFFAGMPGDPKNGTEEIITSSVSEAFPVSDAGLGAVTYMLEILTGLLGSARRWRTMPWLVILFGVMIVPLGAVSIGFIIIQPIVIGTWCTLCLIGAAAMLVQIPYSLDELVATCEFLYRRKKAGQKLLRIFLVGDTDEGRGPDPASIDDFERKPSEVIADMVTGGVNVPWNLALSALLGLWLMFTRLTLGSQGGMANADHLIGALVLTVTVTAWAEVARPIRFLNIPFGLALLVMPFVFEAGALQTVASVACGLALIALAIPHGPVRNRYGLWTRFIV